MDGLSFRDITVPETELEWSFDTSGGPGGQHANRNATRVRLAFDIRASHAIPAAMKDRLISRLGAQANDGEVTVTADDSRSQWRNRAIARERLEELLDEALRPRTRRRRTKPTRASRRRRLEDKRRRSEKKRLRQRPHRHD